MLVTAQLLADPVFRAQRFGPAILFIVALAYGYGATIHINALADPADMTQHRYVAVSKRVSTGKI